MKKIIGYSIYAIIILFVVGSQIATHGIKPVLITLIAMAATAGLMMLADWLISGQSKEKTKFDKH